jgi:hypothetical protein
MRTKIEQILVCASCFAALEIGTRSANIPVGMPEATPRDGIAPPRRIKGSVARRDRK